MVDRSGDERGLREHEEPRAHDEEGNGVKGKRADATARSSSNRPIPMMMLTIGSTIVKVAWEAVIGPA